MAFKHHYLGDSSQAYEWHYCTSTSNSISSNTKFYDNCCLLTWPNREAIQAPVWTRGPSFPKARPPPTEPMLPNICMSQRELYIETNKWKYRVVLNKGNKMKKIPPDLSNQGSEKKDTMSINSCTFKIPSAVSHPHQKWVH